MHNDFTEITMAGYQLSYPVATEWRTIVAIEIGNLFFHMCKLLARLLSA